MGLLSLFSKEEANAPLRLPRGSFSVDSGGHILTSTISQDFPRELVEEIARQVLNAFQTAHAAQLAVSELNVRYGALKITAKELRGGALIFLSPQTPMNAVAAAPGSPRSLF